MLSREPDNKFCNKFCKVVLVVVASERVKLGVSQRLLSRLYLAFTKSKKKLQDFFLPSFSTNFMCVVLGELNISFFIRGSL